MTFAPVLLTQLMTADAQYDSNEMFAESEHQISYSFKMTLPQEFVLIHTGL